VYLETRKQKEPGGGGHMSARAKNRREGAATGVRRTMRAKAQAQADASCRACKKGRRGVGMGVGACVDVVAATPIVIAVDSVSCRLASHTDAPCVVNAMGRPSGWLPIPGQKQSSLSLSSSSLSSSSLSSSSQ